MTGYWRILVVFFLVMSLIQPSSFDEKARNSEIREVTNESLTSPATVCTTPHDPIEIWDDYDFLEQGWPGNGTPGNPFVISGLSIESSEICIEITMTNVHFLVNNCELSGSSLDDNYGIRLYRVENGVLDSNMLDGCGIRVEQSAHVLVANNSVDDAGWDGIGVLRSSQCVISWNQIYNPLSDGIYAEFNVECDYSGNHIYEVASGIRINGDFQSTFRFNYLRYGWFYGIELWPGSQNTLFGNYIAAFEEGLALDSGSGNTWDDGVSIGNLWEPNQTADEVTIPGTADSIDLHPRSTDIPSVFWPIPPLVSGPSDTRLHFGPGYENVSWIVWSIPYSYSILLNGESIDSGDCAGSGCHSVLIEKQNFGSHNLTIWVQDQSNSTFLDIVLIDVTIPRYVTQVIMIVGVVGVLVLVVMLEFRSRLRATKSVIRQT